MKTLIAIALLATSASAVAAPALETIACRDAQIAVRNQGWKTFSVEGKNVTFFAHVDDADQSAGNTGRVIKPFVTTADSEGCVVGYAVISKNKYPREL